MKRGIKFLQLSVRSAVPANTFLVIDAHSEPITGELQWGLNDIGASLNDLTSKLVEKFCGKKLLRAMSETSFAAKEIVDESERAGWYDASAFSRGGWRGLLLSTCSPVIRVPKSFQDLRDLVEK